MLIFHKFPSEEQAKQFRKFVHETTDLGATICASQEESDQLDPFPCELTAPIVLVDRTYDWREEEVERWAKNFGGEFAGT